MTKTLLTAALLCAAASAPAADRAAETKKLHQLFASRWDYTMKEYPEWATSVGYPGQNHRWTDHSEAAIERRKRELEEPARTLAAIDRAALSPEDQLSYDVFERSLTLSLEGRRFPAELLPITQMGGVHQGPVQVVTRMPAGSVKEYEDIVARLRGLPVLVDQSLALLRRGLARGITPPRITLRDVPQQVKNQIVSDPLASPLLAAFTKFPDDVPAADRERLLAEAKAAYTSGIAPAFQRLHDYLARTYIPGSRESIALRDLPDGAAWYAFNARQSTTTSLTPQQIHDIGLAEVKRIRAEMEAAMAEAGFKGTFAEFLQFLRTDPRFFFEKPEDLLAAYRDICKRADPELTRLFGTLPRLPYGVRPVPPYAEKSQPTAYYERGSLSAGRPGYFYANTYDLRSRPRWEMEALSLHEAVPGHHLQLALAQELPEVPDFRKHGAFTAYVEGWGLYAESLGGELGFYRDPYARFGRLTYEMWRAIRLVVDTGLHSLGWSRQQAIDLFRENAAKTEHDIVVEVDRYIVWPGQALAYKIGELKIQELKARARKAQGERFDVRAFHDRVLLSGPVPLGVLEARIDEWLREKR
jgi:uncharacterized protein (DUF885 family)